MCLDVTAAPDGALLLGSLLSTQTPIVPVGPLLFREETYGTPIVFRQDANGNTTHLLIANRPDQTFEKLTWYESPSFHYALLLTCGTLLLSSLIAPLAGLIINRFKRGSARPQPKLARAARGLLAIIAALNLIALLDLGVLLTIKYTEVSRSVTSGDASSVNIPLLLWLIAAILTAAAVAFTVLAWKNHYWNALARAHYTMVTLAALAFIWFTSFWNLLGWGL
jgi:hypothetical protein